MVRAVACSPRVSGVVAMWAVSFEPLHRFHAGSKVVACTTAHARAMAPRGRADTGFAIAFNQAKSVAWRRRRSADRDRLQVQHRPSGHDQSHVTGDARREGRRPAAERFVAAGHRRPRGAMSAHLDHQRCRAIGAAVAPVDHLDATAPSRGAPRSSWTQGFGSVSVWNIKPLQPVLATQAAHPENGELRRNGFPPPDSVPASARGRRARAATARRPAARSAASAGAGPVRSRRRGREVPYQRLRELTGARGVRGGDRQRVGRVVVEQSSPERGRRFVVGRGCGRRLRLRGVPQRARGRTGGGRRPRAGRPSDQ